MMVDVVNLLRLSSYHLSNADRRRIADELEQLRGENEKLRKPAEQLADKTRRRVDVYEPPYPGGARPDKRREE